MKKYFLILFLSLTSWAVIAQTIPSPKEFLGYELGDEFTLHHKVVDYFKTLAEASPRVKLVQYGTTYEGRPLYTAYISSPENIANLEEIRRNNLRHTGLEEGNSEANTPAIVWLSYNVHGNESSSTEASMKTIHHLVNPENTESQQWLENVVVIMDPCINPDGRDRYVNYYKQYGQSPASVDSYAMSHNEEWPGGRVNHYLFDLNRDWLWLSQKESQQRVALYNQWLPQIHVDFHEQSPNSPYYFAPGAEPYHQVITDWQREFQRVIGENHASYFDKQNWSYFTGEVFDLLYPSYGDTYPMFNGAIGMTYEQAGGGSAGRSVKTEYGDTLFLSDRIEHHFTTGISTVEIASKHHEQLLSEFKKYYQSIAEGQYKSFIISGNNSPDKIARLIKLLDNHRIAYGKSSSGKKLSVFSYQSQSNVSYSPDPNDLVIPLNQPKSRLVRAIFEPKTFASDTITYDIMAWNIPYAYGIDAYASTTSVSPNVPYNEPTHMYATPERPPYGYLLPYTAVEDGIFLGALLNAGIEVGVLNKSTSFNGQSFSAGSLVILRGNNEFHPSLDKTIERLALQQKRQPVPVYSGLATTGIDLGSGNISRIKPVRVGLVAGSGTSSNQVGEFWHFFEQQFKYPITLLRRSELNSRVLKNFDVLLLVNGNYADQEETLFEWIQDGGKVVAIQSALNLFAQSEEFKLTSNEDSSEADSLGLSNYAEREREYTNQSIPGAIFRAKMDTSHPLAYGFTGEYETLTRDTDAYNLPYGEQVALLDTSVLPLNGFAGRNALDRIQGKMVLGRERYGRGQVIYFSDDPIFRSFWDQGKLLVINAVLQMN